MEDGGKLESEDSIDWCLRQSAVEFHAEGLQRLWGRLLGDGSLPVYLMI